MSSIWNGSTLRTNYSAEAGFSDTAALARSLRFMNEIQKDICSGHKWQFLKIKMKKNIAIGVQEVDVSPQIPTAPTLAALAGGSLTTALACYVKVTFVLFDETGLEFGSIESQPSVASNTITPAAADLSLTVTAIPLYDGSTSVKPATIHRRLYLKQSTGDYVLSKTLEDNTTVTTTITANSSSLIEPPEYSMIDHMSAENPVIELSGIILNEVKLADIQKDDPALSATGTPQCYARISPNKIMLYPRPSVAVTLAYWVFKKPAQIFADSDRAIQLDNTLESVFEIGVNWKWFKYKQESEWLSVYELYERMKGIARDEKLRNGNGPSTVRRVC